MTDELLQIFHDAYRELRPHHPIPEFSVEFFSFANINNTIRLREGKLLVRVSDLLEGAPEPVLQAIAHILLAKMYRKPIDREHASRYRRYVSSQNIAAKGAPGAADARAQAHRTRRAGSLTIWKKFSTS